MNEYNKDVPEVTPGLATPEITLAEEVSIGVINGALEEIKRQEREDGIAGEEIKKPTVH